MEIWVDYGRNAEEGHLIHFRLGVVEFHLPEEVILQLNEHGLAS